jgi:hypothetical protein
MHAVNNQNAGLENLKAELNCAVGRAIPKICDDPNMAPYLNVDCSQNPYDLRPAVNAIMAAQNWILDRLPKGQKLIIIMGEYHRRFLHTHLREAVLRALDQQKECDPKRSFAYGVELPSNFHSWM